MVHEDNRRRGGMRGEFACQPGCAGFAEGAPVLPRLDRVEQQYPHAAALDRVVNEALGAGYLVERGPKMRPRIAIAGHRIDREGTLREQVRPTRIEPAGSPRSVRSPEAISKSGRLALDQPLQHRRSRRWLCSSGSADESYPTWVSVTWAISIGAPRCSPSPHVRTNDGCQPVGRTVCGDPGQAVSTAGTGYRRTGWCNGA